MNKFLTSLRILSVICLLQLFVIVALGQEKTDNAILRNEGVVELVKAGLSESIIIAKLKGSKTEFDTSANALIKLKEAGVSDSIILTMIEANSKVAEVAKQNGNSESQKMAEMKEAVGKRKIFLVTEDEESRIEIVKKLTNKGFSFVDNKNSAELIFELTYAEGNTQQKAGVFRGGNETAYKTKIGKLVVKLNRDSNEYRSYAVGCRSPHVVRAQ